MKVPSSADVYEKADVTMTLPEKQAFSAVVKMLGNRLMDSFPLMPSAAKMEAMNDRFESLVYWYLSPEDDARYDPPSVP